MRKFLLLANWKMHKTHGQSLDYLKAVDDQSARFTDAVEIVVCAPFTVLAGASSAPAARSVSIGAQNVHHEDWGPYTGEVSAPMLADLGVRYCMVGHSARREQFAESDAQVNSKVRALHRAGISPIVCVGAGRDERRKPASTTLARQIVASLEGVSAGQTRRTVLLYEPGWAIGTGNVATPGEIVASQRVIRAEVERLFSTEVARAVRVAYGGSVNASNLSTLLTETETDGLGLGSQSLDVRAFLEVAGRCAEFCRASPIAR